MNKDVKKIISEAFNELYNEMISEAPNNTSELNPKEKAQADKTLERVHKYGDRSGFSNNGDGESAQKVFNYVIDELVSEYKSNKNPKIKSAIQAAFFPMIDADGRPNKTLNTIKKKWAGKSVNDLQNASASAYEEFLRNFDKVIERYTPGAGSELGNMVISTLNRSIYDFFQKGIRGKGLGGSGDVFGRSGGPASMDAPVGDDEKRTLGDKIAGTSSVGEFSSREADIENKQEMLNVINGWLKNNVSEKQYVAFRELTKGNSPQNVAEEFPEIFPTTPSFPGSKLVSKNFAQLMTAVKKDSETGEKYSLADRISELISHAYNIDFDIKNIIPKNLRQTISIDTDFTGDGTASRIASSETKEATKFLNDVVMSLGADALSKYGIKNKNDFNTHATISKLVNKLKVDGAEEVANEIEGAWDSIVRARNNDSEYGKVTQFVDKVGEKDEFSNMFEGINTFEGFDINILMNRVMEKLSK